jgi:hypothetical protein
MERVETLADLVRGQVAEYAGPALKAKAHFLTNEREQVYGVVDVPDARPQISPTLVLLVQVSGELVIIEEDIHDRPLWEALVKAGIPREKIVLAYAGETPP